MSKNTRRRGSGHGPYVDGLAAVLAHAIGRLDRKPGSTALLIVSRPLGGPNDGGAPIIEAGEKPHYPPRPAVLELTKDEHETAAGIIEKYLADDAYEAWGDLLVAVKVERAGMRIGAMPMPIPDVHDGDELTERAEYLAAPVIERVKSFLYVIENILT